MYPVQLNMTGAGGTIKDQRAANKGGAPLIRSILFLDYGTCKNEKSHSVSRFFFFLVTVLGLNELC